jgi:methyl-accepting chemotaxis protein
LKRPRFRLSLRQKLFGSFGIVVALMAVMAITGQRSNARLQDEYQSLYQNQVQGAVYLANAQDALWQLRYGFPQFMVLTKEEDRKKIVDAEPKWYKVIDDNLAAYGQGNLSGEERQALNEWNEVFTKYKGARPKWFELYGAGKIEEAAEWRAQTTTPWGAGSVAAIAKMIELQRKTAAEEQQTVLATVRQDQKTEWAVIVLALALSTGIAFVLSRSVANGVKAVRAVLTSISDNCATNLANGLNAFARGDLTVEVVPVTRPIEKYGSDEIGQTAAVTNTMLEKIKATMGMNRRAPA